MSGKECAREWGRGKEKEMCRRENGMRGRVPFLLLNINIETERKSGILTGGESDRQKYIWREMERDVKGVNKFKRKKER